MVAEVDTEATTQLRRAPYAAEPKGKESGYSIGGVIDPNC